MLLIHANSFFKAMALTEQDNFKLNEILARSVELIEKVGIAPTFEQASVLLIMEWSKLLSVSLYLTS